MASTFDSTLSSLGIPRTATTAVADTSKLGERSLDQSDFLSLMTAQLKNQDPFAPVDNTQMVAQMAQFSSVAGISQMNTTLSSLAAKLGGTTSSDALAYVGKTVLTEGGVAYGRAAGGIAGAVELDGDASDVQVQISDAAGQPLKTIDLGQQSAGTVKYDWDGKDADGADAGAGPFTVAVAAVSGNASVVARSLVWAPVESVSMPSSGTPKLQITGIGPVDPSAVRQAG
ncbi:flagellar hook assembly protein FlgD [Sphingomonas oligophenolica]|uniref:Basal-body rod modification protein FlgD n=1 Tax=Sphingomonas oligophenolica TaxID=301154 RepID=A0A502CSK9_9SPHN|nr:flagellar hook capping FlgD N-terminal domain-containing protein [Sphingomonas oligophenolica]TPG15674.1 flagellar hook assembly protein FlgD [Sphingomonas oligophenolica]